MPKGNIAEAQSGRISSLCWDCGEHLQDSITLT